MDSLSHGFSLVDVFKISENFLRNILWIVNADIKANVNVDAEILMLIFPCQYC